MTLGVTLGLALAASPAFAYCRTTTCAVTNPPIDCERDANGCWTAGIPLFWTQRCLSFSVNQAGSPALGLDYATAEGLVASGFDLWPSAVCPGGSPSIMVESLGPLICDRREYNVGGPNANAILFRDDGWEYDASVIALTSVVFNSRTGEILGADIEINSGDYALSQINVQYVIAHESGHFFGLDHTPDPSAIMYFQYGLDRVTAPVLQPDDIAAICAAYPPARVTPACNYEPPHGFALDCGGDVIGSCAVAPGVPSGRRSATAWMALLLLAAAAGRWRRRARRRRSAQPAR
jgi:hypothetical protein